jgi:hypothetical protein
LKKSSQELRDVLFQLFTTEKLKNQAAQSIIKFCKEPPDTIKPFQSRFIKLSDKLTKNDEELQGTTNDIGSYSHLKPLARDVYPNEVHKLLLDGVKNHASCVQGYHIEPALNNIAQNDWHPTRLCLNSGFRSKNQLALFNIITATPKMTYWQEIAINIPL